MLSDIRAYQCREIITKAVCGKGHKFSQGTHVLTASYAPNTILGCWVINHKFKAHKVGDVVEVVGSYDIDVWYSYENNTKTDVAKAEIKYVEPVPLSYLDPHQLGESCTVVAECSQEPRCVEASLLGDRRIAVEVEKELVVEVIGETKLKVLACHSDDAEEKEVDFDMDDELDDWEDASEADILLDDVDTD